MRRRKFLKYTASGVAGAAIMGTVGCGDDDDSDDGGASSGAAGESPAAGDFELADKQVLRTRFYFQLLPMDPATIFGIEQENTATAIYSGLTKYGTKTELQADLAESWEQPDDSTYVFHIRPNAVWQGEYGPVTAEDVAASYSRIIEGKGSYAAEFGLVQSFTSLDEKTLQVKLSAPDPAFPHQVVNYHQGSVINVKALDALGDNHWFNPIGTGPFILGDVKPGESFVLKRFQEHFMGPATLSEIQMRTIADANTAAIALINNEIDVFQAIRSEPALDMLEADSNVYLADSGQWGVSLSMVNSTLSHLRDPRIRKAYQHAVDWDNNITATTPRLAMPHNNIVPDWMPEYTADVPVYEHDPTKARQLLDAAGFGNGLTVKSIQLSQPNENLLLQQADLAKVGIKLEFEVLDRAQFNQRRVSGDYEIAGRGNPAGNINFLLFSYLHPDNFPPVGFNGARYSNADVTSAMVKARSELDEAKRLELYHFIQRQVMEDLPYIVGGASVEWWAARSKTRGLTVNAMPQANWYDLAIAKG